MRIYNTLSRSVDEFSPVDDTVKMYTCGPTVYDFMHIGNLRTFVLSDWVERAIKQGSKVKSVQNITDIDDKIIKRAKEKNVSIKQLSEEFTKYFMEDIKALNIQDKDEYPKATEYIPKMIWYIKDLVEKGIAYAEGDGSVYFDISKFPDYGRLSGVKQDELKTGTRVLSDEYTKEDVQDFALWKAVSEDDEVGFDSPWGRGRPGWHIECSVMSQETLADTIDIHLGGVDLIFPHHENEIAQSEAKTGKPFSRFFVHGAHILVEGQKMSKSLNNFFTLKDVKDKGFDPLALRYLYLQTHYRQEMNFTWEALEGAQNALNKLRKTDWKDEDAVSYEEKFFEAVNDDLNMPQALSVLWEMVKDKPSLKSAKRFDEVLGLKLFDFEKEEIEVPQEIRDLVNKRDRLRAENSFEEADRVRQEIEAKGFVVEDTPQGSKVSKN